MKLLTSDQLADALALTKTVITFGPGRCQTCQAELIGSAGMDYSQPTTVDLVLNAPARCPICDQKKT